MSNASNGAKKVKPFDEQKTSDAAGKKPYHYRSQFPEAGKRTTEGQRQMKERIKKGDIYVATDVFPEEPVKKNDPIRKLKNVLFSAHRAGALEEAFFDMGEIVLKDMSLILKKKPPKFCKRAERKTVKLLASKPVAIN